MRKSICAVALGLAACSAAAQSYPSRPIHIVDPKITRAAGIQPE